MPKAAPGKTDLLTLFCDWVKRTIDAEGVYPFPAIWRAKEGEQIMVNAMACDPDDVLHEVWRQISCHEVTELVFGLDRTTRAGQGTEFADVLTCAHWSPEFDKSWNRAWRPFVINYQHEPRIVRPPDFENDFWNGQIRAELASCCPPLRIVTHRHQQQQEQASPA